MTQYWLMKSEPLTYGIDDLKRAPKGIDYWDGVRNYQANNYMRRDMKKGDMALFYHSNTRPPGVAGLIQVVREGYPDHTAFDKTSKYYDPRSTPDRPRWMMVDIKFKRKFSELIPLTELRSEKALKKMQILKKGSRLSITPLTKSEFDHIMEMADRP